MRSLPSSTEESVSRVEHLWRYQPANTLTLGQLQKIGVLQSSKNPQTTPGSAKRRSGQLDFSNLNPLKAGGTVGFSTFRDQGSEAARRRKARKKSNGNIAEDSDDDDDDDSDALAKLEEPDDKDVDGKLAPEDAQFQGELADGVNRIHVSSHVSRFIGLQELTTGNSLREHTRQIPTASRPQKHHKGTTHPPPTVRLQDKCSEAPWPAQVALMCPMRLWWEAR